MRRGKPMYVVDEQGRTKDVLLDIATYRALLKRIEELEDALELDETVRTETEFRLYETIRTRFTFVGSGASGRSDISERHDEAFAEDLCPPPEPPSAQRHQPK